MQRSVTLNAYLWENTHRAIKFETRQASKRDSENLDLS